MDKLERERQLSFLKPIWEAKKWNFYKLKQMPDYKLLGIYLAYKNDPNKVQQIMANKQYEQISFLN